MLTCKDVVDRLCQVLLLEEEPAPAVKPEGC